MSSDPTSNQHPRGPDSPPGSPPEESRLERWATAPYAADPLDVPAAERRRRRRELWLSSLVLVAIAVIAIGQQWVTAPRGALPAGDSALFLFLNALNVFLIFLLIYLVARNLVKLVFERRRGALGSHLNLKFVLAFALIATVPTVVLFLVSSAIIGNSINTWFSLQIDRTLDESRQVADAYYQSASDEALFFAHRIADQVTERRLLREEEDEALATFVQDRQSDYHLGVVEVFSTTGEALVVAVNPDIPAANFSRPDSDLVSSALAGNTTTRVEEVVGGSVIRGAVPIGSSFKEKEAVGAVVVNHFVPFSLAQKIEQIRAVHDEYRRLQPYAGHIERLYQLELLLFSLVVVLFAIWWGFRIAKGVSTPIRALAEGTAEVARGNLDVQVGSALRRRGRLPGALLQPHDPRPARRARRSRAHQRRAGAAPPLHGGGAAQHRRGRGLARRRGARPHHQSRRPAPARHPAGRRARRALVGRGAARARTARGGARAARDLRSGVRESIRRQVQLPAGDETLTLLVTVTLLKDEENLVLGTVVVFDDYSQLVKVQRMEAWQEVARRIAHEIKNPLTPIQLSAQRIRRRFRRAVRSRSGRRQGLRRVRRRDHEPGGRPEAAGERVLELRAPARREPRARRPEPHRARGRVALRRHRGRRAEDRPRPEPAARRPRPRAVRRLLTNLIDNAVAAVRERVAQEPDYDVGHVELRTVHDAPLHAVRLEVVDDGIGIRPEDRRRIFEPYFSRKEHGTGLGLAIVSRIVADHRGYVRVHDAQPRGARFIVELPAAPNEHAHAAARASG